MFKFFSYFPFFIKIITQLIRFIKQLSVVIFFIDFLFGILN